MKAPAIPYFALMGDLAANILALTLLLLVLQIEANRLRAVPAAPPVAEDQAGFYRQPPMGGARAVAFLHQRRPDAPGTSLDLHADRIVISTGGRETATSCAPDAMKGVAAPVRIAVFAPDCLAAILPALRAEGVTPAILSAPVALRTQDGRDWSPAFRRLITAGLDQPAFARELARLLSRSPTLRPGGGVAGAGEGQGAGAGEPPPTLAARVLSVLESFAAWTLALGAGLVLLIAEGRRLSSLRRAP